MELQKEPMLGEFGLNVSSYLHHRKNRNDLIELKNSLSFSFWNYLFIVPMPILGILFFIFNINIFSAIFLSIFSLVFFETIRDYFNNRSSDYAEISNKITNYQKESKIGDFESALGEYCYKEINYYYKNSVFRKRCGREGGLHLAHLIKEYGDISNFFHYSNSYYYSGYNEYLAKRFSINPNYIGSESNYFEFTNIINQIKGKPVSVLKKENILLVNNEDITDNIKVKKIKNTENLLANLKKTEQIFNNSKQEETKELIPVENKKEKEKSFWRELIEKANVEINEPNNFSLKNETKSETAKEIIDIINTAPPEKLYRIPRKVDWENLNKNKAKIGNKGEEIVMEIEQNYLKSINRTDLAEKVEHVSKEGDGFGYDILSFFPSGQEKYIEVKSSSKVGGHTFYLSQNELEFMKKNKYKAYIYRVQNVNDEGEAPTLKVHSAEEILMFNKIIPIQYVVKME